MDILNKIHDNTPPPPAMPPRLSRHYKAYCDGCRCVTYVENSDRKGGLCHSCLFDNMKNIIVDLFPEPKCRWFRKN